MGTGKTTVGAALAQRLGRQFLDNDVLLERRTGKTAAELRRGLGENALHQVEAEVLLTCLAVRPVAVIAAAASTIDNRKVREALLTLASTLPDSRGMFGYRGHFARMGFDDALTELEERRERGAPDSEIVEAFPRELLLLVGYYGTPAKK